MARRDKQTRLAKANRSKQRKLAKRRKQAIKRQHRQEALGTRAAIRAVPAKPAMPTANASARNRCGKCTACCTAIGVEELGKPHYRPCPHVTENGCAIYAGRPPSCRDFGCVWLNIPGADESLRPDNLGVLFTLDAKPNPGGCALFVEVWEVREGAMKTKLVHDLARSIDQRKVLISATCWYPAGIPVPVRYAIDGERWPEDVHYGNRYDAIRMDRQGKHDLVYRGDAASRPALPSRNVDAGHLPESSSRS